MARDKKRDPEDVLPGGLPRDTADKVQERRRQQEEAGRSGRRSRPDTTGDKAESKQQKGDKSAEQGEDKVSDDGTRTMWERIRGTRSKKSDWKGTPYK